MKVDDCYQLGYVSKTRGLNGEVIIHLDVDAPSEYTKLESVFLELSGKLVPFFISQIQVEGRNANVLLEDVADVDTASRLIGSRAFLPLKNLPKLGDDAYYYHELIGFEVIKDGSSLGPILEIFDQEVNPVFSFECEGKEVLVPLRDEFLIRVVKKEKKVEISLPEGYLDVYLNDSKNET